MKKVVILSGISGSGKSTYAAKLASDNRDSTIVSADKFFCRSTGEYVFDVRLLSAAHSDCFRRFIDALMCGDSLVIVDNTNTTVAEISPYALGAQAFLYDFEIVTIHCPLDVAVKRNVHGVTSEVAAKQLERLADRKLPLYWRHHEQTSSAA